MQNFHWLYNLKMLFEKKNIETEGSSMFQNMSGSEK